VWIIVGVIAVAVLALAIFFSERMLRLAMYSTLLAGGLWLIFSISWNAPLTLHAVVQFMVGVGLLFIFVVTLRHYLEIRDGLHQWPNASGPYYDRWMSLPHGEDGNYYEWLAEQKGWREPWRTWAEWDKPAGLNENN